MMRITETLPQFEESKALLIVAGARVARFLVAHKGEIVEPRGVKSENRTYSDREGHFERRGHGEMYGSGSVYEEKDFVMTKKFLKELATQAKQLAAKERIEKIFLFAPAHNASEVLSSLPASLQKMHVHTVKGNVIHEHHFDLIRRLPRSKVK